MTNETFEKVTKLHERLKSLRDIRTALDSEKVIGLAYISMNILGSSQIRGCISEILDRHDKMIREEIDKEIEAINKQIAEL